MTESPPVKTFDELFAELSDRAKTRPEGSGTVAALDAGVHTLGRNCSKRRVRCGWLLNTRVTNRLPKR